MKERIIIFGASKLGEMSYTFYKDTYDIICFCDNDAYKIGNSINGKRIISIDTLVNYLDVRIIIASQYYEQIKNQLLSLGITKFEKSRVSIDKNGSRNGIDDDYYCPICDKSVSRFLPYNNRRNAKCPYCNSLERHRLIWLFFNQRTNLFDDKVKMLHIAPEPIFAEKFLENKNIDYITGDINITNKYVKEKIDIQKIQYANDTFDIIYCSHVLEHVPNDLMAMRELRRVLKPEGWAVLQVPINDNLVETLEKDEYNTPELRTKYYGQYDHLRLYGRDYIGKLKSVGFKVEKIDYNSIIGESLVRRYGLMKNDYIFKCTK